MTIMFSVLNKRHGKRGSDKRPRKKRVYPTIVKIEIRVPEKVATWLRHSGKPSKVVTKLVQEKLDYENFE